VSAVWWIDSNCINQNDDDERSSQVQMMDQIYLSSCQTIGWLGKIGTDEIGLKAMEFLSELFHNADTISEEHNHATVT
jgi:hypothetical protein